MIKTHQTKRRVKEEILGMPEETNTAAWDPVSALTDQDLITLLCERFLQDPDWGLNYLNRLQQPCPSPLG